MYVRLCFAFPQFNIIFLYEKNIAFAIDFSAIVESFISAKFDFFTPSVSQDYLLTKERGGGGDNILTSYKCVKPIE